jgi:hypothetical protein
MQVSFNTKEVSFFLALDNDTLPIAPVALIERLTSAFAASGIHAEINTKTGEITVPYGRMDVSHSDGRTVYQWCMPVALLASKPLNLPDWLTRDPYPDLPQFPDLAVTRKARMLGCPWKEKK